MVVNVSQSTALPFPGKLFSATSTHNLLECVHCMKEIYITYVFSSQENRFTCYHMWSNSCSLLARAIEITPILLKDHNCTIIPLGPVHTLYLASYRIDGKFGSLAVYITTAKLKSAKISYSHIIRMTIPYQTAKSKSTNILAIIVVILGSTTKFNSRQIFLAIRYLTAKK